MILHAGCAGAVLEVNVSMVQAYNQPYSIWCIQTILNGEAVWPQGTFMVCSWSPTGNTGAKRNCALCNISWLLHKTGFMSYIDLSD